MNPNWKEQKLVTSDCRLFFGEWQMSDGDLVSLYLAKDLTNMEVHCFSGITASFIFIDDVDFSIFNEHIKHNCDEKEQQFLDIADHLCSLFCKKK